MNIEGLNKVSFILSIITDRSWQKIA